MDWANSTDSQCLVLRPDVTHSWNPFRNLVFRRLDGGPSQVDIVNVYRPENEHEGIVVNYIVPLGAKTVWLHPSIGSDTARQLAGEYGFELVKGVDIADAAR